MSHGKVVYRDRRRVSAVYDHTTRLIDVATAEETVTAPPRCGGPVPTVRMVTRARPSGACA
ncbi:hypothetical protein [Streptomyces sp. E-15]